MTLIGTMSALAQPTRLRVFTLLTQAGAEGLTSGELARRAGAAANTMSAHLAVLGRAGLVEAERDGRHSLYRAVPGTVRALSDELLGMIGEQRTG